MTVHFEGPHGNTVGMLAHAELRFTTGPLKGLRLVGFNVWEGRNGRLIVTMPARQYSFNGERRSFALLRCIEDPEDADKLKDLIADEYRRWAAVNPRELV